MIGQFRFLLLVIVSQLLANCNSSMETSTVFFGGKIINPKGKNVVLFANENPLDTFLLDENNNFFGALNNIKSGLYYFRHGGEYQYVYLEPKDSILFRLNAWDFDESLVFSGKGALRNNLLIDCFLDNEKQEKKFYELYDLTPKDFKNRVDSIERNKLLVYDNFIVNNPRESENYLKVLKIALTYPLYRHIESYPMVHGMKNKDDYASKLTNNFYNHREKIEIFKDTVIYFSAYRNYLINHLYNKVFTNGHKIGTDDFTIHLLNTIDKDLLDGEYKEAVLLRTIVGHFLEKSSCNYSKRTFETYIEIATNEKNIQLVTNLINDLKYLHAGKNLLNFYIKNYNHSHKPIESIIKGKNTVISFWNPKYTSKEYINGRIKYLMKKFPTLEYVLVKIDGDGVEKLDEINIVNQYYIDDESEANKFLESKLPRTLLISKSGTVVNGYASISSSEFYEQLKSLKNK